MNRTSIRRLLALCLALVCLVSVVSALSFDLSGDGKTDVWDLQLAVNEGKTDTYADALTEALGGRDNLHPNAEGVYEIYNALGLYNMASHAAEGATFELKADIDMGGKVWIPVTSFKGNFHGNGHTISNLVIHNGIGEDAGFIALLDRYTAGGKTVQSVVKDLTLENVTITEKATANALYVGLLAGSNRGIVENCTATGTVYDSRTEHSGTVYVGAIVGRNNNHDTMPGTVKGGTNTLTATAGSPNSADQVTGVTAKLAMFFADGVKHKVGIAGYSKADIDLCWQDTTGSIAYKSETEQTRRQTAVDHMYKQGTVRWTTSEEITYTNGKTTSTHSTVYIPGRTYVGIPYNGSGLSYAHFTSVMQAEKDAQGRFVTVTGLESGTVDKTGFVAKMGNDCSSAVGWAWASVLPARVSNYGTRVNVTPYMVPNAYNKEYHGILPSGGYQVLPTNPEKYASGVDARDTRSIIALNGGAEGMAEYYAKASRGDALLFVEYELDAATDTWVKDGGHARMLAYDPVIIRKGDGSIDLDASYVITHEQGDGLFDNRLANGNYESYKGYYVKQTSWRTDYKYPLSVLLTEKGYNAATRPGCGYGYVPVTPQGFAYEGQLRAPYGDFGYTEHPVIQPNGGWIYSNYMIVGGTMTIRDSEGNVVYNKTAYNSCDLRGSIYQTLKLDVLFADATENLVEGQTYYQDLQMLISNGTVIKRIDNKAFTYPSTEILK